MNTYILYNDDTEKFYMNNGKWTQYSTKAKLFNSYQEAIHYADKYELFLIPYSAVFQIRSEMKGG